MVTDLEKRLLDARYSCTDRECFCITEGNSFVRVQTSKGSCNDDEWARKFVSDCRRERLLKSGGPTDAK